MIKQRLTRIAASTAIALGTLGATLTGAALHAAPAAAQDWHGGDQDRGHYQERGHWDRAHNWHPDGWRDRDGRWHVYGYAPPPPVYVERGPRYFDREHGYWRDRLGYWNPHSGLYVSFHF
jgi:hypothetical protein